MKKDITLSHNDIVAERTGPCPKPTTFKRYEAIFLILLYFLFFP